MPVAFGMAMAMWLRANRLIEEACLEKDVPFLRLWDGDAVGRNGSLA